MSIKFTTPTPETPGFLRRLKRAMQFNEQISTGKMSAVLIDDLVDFLSGFVVEMGRDEAKEALMDASQEQFTEMLNAVVGVQSDAVPLASKS